MERTFYLAWDGNNHYRAPQARGAYNASTLDEVATDTCNNAAEKLKADKDIQARENINKAVPQ